MDQKKGPPIGIDLGTAYTRVAVFDGSNCSIIPDEYGNTSMPSYVAFTNAGVLVGEAARMQALYNPTNTIFDVIRLIGRCYSDPSVRHDMRLWPFKVIAGPDEQLLVEVHWKSKLWQFTPAEICSIIMMQVKVIAESNLGSTIVDAVISVPVHFNCKQRLEMKLAGTIAGLNFTKIISAPAASAFSYGMERMSRSSNIFPNIITPLSTSEPDKHKLHKIVIFDLGAGTLDVAVVTIKDDVCKVLATAGDLHLGGSDFDNNMIDHFVTYLKQCDHKDIINIPTAICKLRTFCEKAKIALCSGNDMVPMKISPLYDDVNLDSSITEANFNELNGSLFQKIIDILFRCFIDAHMRIDDVDEVIMVGGATRICLLHSKISSLFVGKEVIRSRNSETATVYGAAIQAFFHSRGMKGRLCGLSLLDAAPFSLGLSSAYGNMIVCIPKNITIPTNIKKSLHFQYPKNTPIPFEVYEGEGTLTSQNRLLGKFELSIPQFSPKGYFIDVHFQIHEDGSLMVRAEEISNGTKNHITITCGNIKESKMRVSKALVYNISATNSFSKNGTSSEWDRMRGKGVSIKEEGPRKIMDQSSTQYVESEEYAIGIDFGTTFSSVAVWQQNSVKIIKNEYDEPLTYSCVAFTDTGRLIGGAVHKKQFTRDPENTIHNIKRLVGRSRSDWSVQNGSKFLPFRILYGDKGRSMVSVHYKNERNCFALEEIAALILSKMKEIAEACLNSKVTNAVVSIPACFSDSQRKAIKDAGTIAGLNVMQLLNEPTATAITYFLQKVNAQNSTLLIFDLGGGHLDVSVVDIDGCTIQVRAAAGDTNLGGEDFDNNMVSYFVQNFMREHRKDISNKPRCLSWLKEACEKAKRILSQFMQTMIEIDALDDGIDFRTSITREVFEEINMDLFKRCIKCIEQCLRDAKLDKSFIDEVVLVGGSTRIPKIKQLLQDFFNGKEVCSFMNVDETVAYGAAVQAAILCGNKDIKKFCGLKVQDVTNFSLWLEGTGGAMNLLIPRGTLIPMKKEMLFSTCSNYQMRMSIGVCCLAINNEESRVVFTLSNIPSKPTGYSEIFVSFEINDDGILNLTAKLVNASEMDEIMISKDNCLTTAELHKMTETVVRFIAEDEENKARDVALNSLENFAYKMKKISRDPGLPASSKKLVEEAAVDAISWLETHYNAGMDQISFWKKKLEIIESQIVYLGTDAS